ncbi:MAG: DUF2958 domain-containing protein [Sphingomonadales bacterium]|nr:MAG: DUF2958 domain-containing protein [Sphingomonadales bacterium]
MIVLPPALRASLRFNHFARRTADRDGTQVPDPVPVVRLFNPLGPATWLASELDADDDTLFGLADLGFGFPELGVFSLSEIADVRLPFGLRIERDLGFRTDRTLSQWADMARRAGSILHAEARFRAAAREDGRSQLPPSEKD